jgi:hypothetical protein
VPPAGSDCHRPLLPRGISVASLGPHLEESQRAGARSVTR